MGRAPRADEAGGIYHALNRGNAKSDIFFKEADFEAFENLIVEGLEKFLIDLIAYQWMTNHWHLVLSPRVDGGMSAFIGWITLTHTQRYHAHHGTTGLGHVYQGRYKSFPIQDDDHFYVVCRYVERNALTAKIVKRAEAFRWGSLYNWLGGESPIELATWPVRRLPVPVPSQGRPRRRMLMRDSLSATISARRSSKMPMPKRSSGSSGPGGSSDHDGDAAASARRFRRRVGFTGFRGLRLAMA